MEETIHTAVCSSSIQRVREILQRNPSCVNDLDVDLNSPLHLLYYYDYGNESNHLADNRLLIMKLLIEYGANVDILNTDYVTPLYLAIKKYQINDVEILLENDANPNIRNYFNRSALMEAIRDDFMYGEYEKIIKLLLDYGADPNLTDLNGETALDQTLKFETWNSMQILLAFGARVKNVYRTFRNILVFDDMYELQNEDYSILIDFLWSHKAQIIKRGRFSISNLGFYFKAHRWNRNERVFTFLESLRSLGVIVDDCGSDDSDLHKAVRTGNAKAVKGLLEEKETNVNAQNFFFDTSLHLLIKIKNKSFLEEIGCLLLKAGANWRTPNLMDETPFYLAVINQQYTLVNLMLSKIARVDDASLECDITNLPTLEIRYTENDIALHELLVAISVNCEPAIDHLLDEFYDIIDASICFRQDITIALVKAIQINKYNIVKKLLEAGFRTDRQFFGDLFVWLPTTKDKIILSCLLWGFNDRTALATLIYDTVRVYSSNLDANALINLLLLYYTIDECVTGSDLDLIRLQVFLKRCNIFTAKLAECKNDLFQMKNIKIMGVSFFNIMTMELDLFVKLLNNEEFYDSCVEKVLELHNLSESKYLDVALQSRLELALEKNLAMNTAIECFNDISKNYFTRTKLTSLPYRIGWDILSNLNMRDVKKLAYSNL